MPGVVEWDESAEWGCEQHEGKTTNNRTWSCNWMSILVAPSGECLQGEGLVWLNGMRVLSGTVNTIKGKRPKTEPRAAIGCPFWWRHLVKAYRVTAWCG